ncbi:DUF2730 family protein [Shewanella sp. KCT]|uniref:DUF2730 family protein n=1 Tax=Shewanella sp. KCT TaxID=2569535 RepID=UPI001181F5C5|nr:DUF2730 family protein [Shewanella sp. KCT]TVP15383.1 hypothetical protein AYI87_06875 [Shewanella sp. KCT]
MANAFEFINANFKWLSALGYLAFMGLFAWFHVRFTPRKEHDQLHERVGNLDQQMTQVQADIKHLPKQKDINRLDNTLSGLTEAITATKNGINRLEKKTDLLLENELRK